MTDPVRVGAPVTFDEPVVVDYRNGTWKLNPTSAITPGDEPVTVKNTRTNAPTKETLGDADITLASFNVLNYFTTTGEDWINAGHTCSSYTDKDGQAITTRSCSDNGPRGAWDTESFTRQQNKIVAAINALDASVVGLLEIENSAALGEDTDEATTTLVAALNAAAGEKRWAAVASSQQLPPASEQDAITNAIIYQVDHVELLGQPQALGDKSGAGQAFSNAREPIGQAFIPATDGEPFFYVVNHFKSKGSAGPLPGDDDQGDGQGSSNASRVAQATALTQWVPTALDTIAKETGTTITDVALAGDFNAYTREDPMTVLSDAGYTNAAATHAPDKASYSYQGLSGSLDHILYNDSFADRITGADIWNINAPESIALEYSRYNYHGTVFYENNAYRSSDHDPVIVGVTAGSGTTTPATIDLNILDINDFHGRIDANTVAFAGTIEEARSEHPDTTVFLSAGDNIGASLFASSVADDKPTLDVLNTLDLAASAVGNHEFDVSFDHLTTQIKEWSQFPYLGANVYTKGTTTPALDEYTVIDVDGVAVGVIGAVTEETPSLVTPGGIADIEFGDPVDAVNRVAEQLTDGDDTNGEADVIVALYHEGASAGTPDGSTLEEEIDAGGVFADIATLTSAEVDAIFTGHTHKQYAWLADNNGTERPIIQTGSYGDHIGQAVLTLDTTTKRLLRHVPPISHAPQPPHRNSSPPTHVWHRCHRSLTMPSLMHKKSVRVRSGPSLLTSPRPTATGNTWTESTQVALVTTVPLRPHSAHWWRTRCETHSRPQNAAEQILVSSTQVDYGQTYSTVMTVLSPTRKQTPSSHLSTTYGQHRSQVHKSKRSSNNNGSAQPQVKYPVGPTSS